MWVTERKPLKSRNTFAYRVVMVRKVHGFNLFYFIISFKLGAGKRDNNEVWVTERKPLKGKNIFACFPAVLSQQHSQLMFLLSCAAEIKDLPIQRTYCQTDLDKKIVLFGSEQHFG